MTESNPKALLCIEDDVNNQILLKFYFKKTDYTITIVADGDAAIEKMDSTIFDAVLMDWNIPGGLQGEDLIAALRNKQQRERMPIIILTAFSELDDITQGNELDVELILHKPVMQGQLLQALEEIL